MTSLTPSLQMFKHFLITRYNLHIPGWEVTKNNEKIDDEWMNHRYELFRNYCYPSVVNQSNQDFTWLIFMNVDTKENHKKEILDITQNHSNFRIVFIDGYKCFLKALRRIIVEETRKEQYLITTRLDNDDCIRKDFIQLVHNEFDSQGKCIIDFPLGLSLEIEPQVRLAYRRIRLNPFISLIENVHSFQTVMHYFGHRGWDNSRTEVRSNTTCRSWLQIVHNKNKRNALKGLILSGKTNLLPDFGIFIPEGFSKPNVYLMMRHFMLVFLLRLKNRIRFTLSFK